MIVCAPPLPGDPGRQGGAGAPEAAHGQCAAPAHRHGHRSTCAASALSVCPVYLHCLHASSSLCVSTGLCLSVSLSVGLSVPRHVSAPTIHQNVTKSTSLPYSLPLPLPRLLLAGPERRDGPSVPAETAARLRDPQGGAPGRLHLPLARGRPQPEGECRAVTCR